MPMKTLSEPVFSGVQWWEFSGSVDPVVAGSSPVILAEDKRRRGKLLRRFAFE